MSDLPEKRHKELDKVHDTVVLGESNLEKEENEKWFQIGRAVRKTNIQERIRYEPEFKSPHKR